MMLKHSVIQNGCKMRSESHLAFDDMLNTALLFAEAKNKTAGKSVEEILLKLSICDQQQLADNLETALINEKLYRN